MAIDSEVGAIVERLGAEPFAGAPEAADHLVGDHQDVVLAADRADRLEVALRAARSTPPAPITGSAMKAATVSGPSASISASSSAASRAAKAASLSPGSAPFQKCGVAMWRMPAHRQVEVAVVVGQPGQRGRDDGDAVVAP